MIGKFLGSKLGRMFGKMGYTRLDKALIAKWPVGWPAAKKTARGWKTITAALILAWPAISETVQAAGFDPALTARWLGVGLLTLGMIDKGFKWWAAFDESLSIQDSAETPEEVPSAPPLHPPVLNTKQDHDRFNEILNDLQNNHGMSWERAREKALAKVFEEKAAKADKEKWLLIEQPDKGNGHPVQ